jgi:hypothetical protein
MTVSGGAGRGSEAVEAVREHRDDLKALADTGLPVAKWAERLLSILDDTSDGGGRM